MFLGYQIAIQITSSTSNLFPDLTVLTFSLLLSVFPACLFFPLEFNNLAQQAPGLILYISRISREFLKISFQTWRK